MNSLFARRWLVIACGILALLSENLALSEGPPKGKMDMPPPEVGVLHIKPEATPIVREQVGRLAATRVAQVRARVTGIVLERVYTEGSDVRRGQVLFRIDPAPLKATLHASLADLARAQADAANTAQIARRYAELLEKHLISRQDADSARANAAISAATVKQAQANVEKAQLDLGYATVTAPIAGRAGRALVTEGALVMSGQGETTPLTTIEQIDPLYVNFSPPSTDLETLRRSTQIAVTLPDGSNYPQIGTLDFADAAVDANTGTISLRARLPNPQHRLLPGMFVHLRFVAGQRTHTYRLPQAALARDAKGAYVLVTDAMGKVAERRVRVHDMTTSEWVVSGDIGENEGVIISGQMKVQPGATAKPVPWTETPAAESPAPATDH